MAKKVSKNGRVYKKYEIKGLDISIETPKGWVRRGTDKDGTSWETTMKDDYGYFQKTKGHDGDHIDCFVGPDHEPEKVYVVYQIDDKGSLDEHKCMLGYKDIKDAKKSYLRNYDTDKYFGSIKEYDFDEFKEKILKTLHQSTAVKQLGRKAQSTQRLVKLANRLDQQGQYKKAEQVDNLIKIDKSKLPIIWYENEDGEQWLPPENYEGGEEPKGFFYQHSQFPNVLVHNVLEIIQEDKVEDCKHPDKYVLPTFGWVNGMEGRECKYCGGTQEKGTDQSWPKKWEAYGSRSAFSMEASWPEDLVLAMATSGDYTLSEAILIAANCCERCMNALADQYGIEWGYPKGSEEWLKCGTECEFCENSAEDISSIKLIEDPEEILKIKLIEISNQLDQKGLYKEADRIDRLIVADGKPWTGVDLDATFAYYEDGYAQEGIIGKPIPEMLKRVLNWLEEGKKVKIFTARVSGNDTFQEDLIRKYLDDLGLNEVEITCEKDYLMEELWDDRAVQVEKNTGKRIGEEV